ncbi:hypothetical protein PTTG_03609 [Puccinia triticina 1-1 BBBD Race 1]|uniref:MARVEL domain-containing protein n=2 Tax=Puccinia triticina TaxID=208348 RepID=A0A0C4ES35_PUCT1|nr:hypothetical protein PTTG_03609 [Puccinia triticina 1-1 BBBD Race 1]WAR54006.1 hypothetical protein PtB15_3B516 [Puccinia triticina]
MSTTATPAHHQSTLHRIILPILFSLALLFSVIQFIITAVLVHDYDDHGYPSGSHRDRLRFLLFTSCWSLLFLPIYLFANLRLLGHVLSSVASNLGFIALTWLFWLCAAASWTDVLGGTVQCGDLFLNNQVIDISVPYCGASRAVQAFAWMLWLLFSAALIYITTVAFRAKSHSSGLTGPMRQVPAATSAA